MDDRDDLASYHEIRRFLFYETYGRHVISAVRFIDCKVTLLDCRQDFRSARHETDELRDAHNKQRDTPIDPRSMQLRPFRQLAHTLFPKLLGIVWKS